VRRLRRLVSWSLGLAAVALLVPSARADGVGLDALQQVLGDTATSPIPQGWTLGGVVYNGSSTYSAGETATWVVPGGIYIGKEFMYLGDRAYYTFGKRDGLSFFGRLRVRLGNLDPEDSPEWAGLSPRKSQLEAGLGAVMVSPVGLWAARFSSDVSGRSKGTEVLLSWSAPVVGNRWLVMPSAGLFWRSSGLANYYFGGVSAAEAAPGRPPYDVGATWSFAPALLASYRLSPSWLVGAVLSYEAFAGSVKDGPLVQKRGRYDALIGLGYVWR